MNIDYICFSCDDSDMYSDFWNPISKFWKTKVGIHPVLLHYGSRDDLSTEFGDIYRVGVHPEIPSYMVGCWGRFWLASNFDEKVCTIGDIDLILLNFDIFYSEMEKYEDNAYVHLSADSYFKNDFSKWENRFEKFSAAYHTAKGCVFKKALQIEDDFYQEMFRYKSFDFSSAKCHEQENHGYAVHYEPHLIHASKHMGGNWGQDEYIATEMVRQYKEQGGLVSVGHSMQIPEKRLDRSNWNYNEEEVVNGFYNDSHLLRPYKQNKEEIDKLLNLMRPYDG
tara:strand:- start:323 stop:1162 length:840 start_codon:yes stop_codon:yes gene_type:complete